MQVSENCQRHIWLLSGTGEGPQIASELIKRGWKVTVSVVSYKATDSYSDLKLERLLVGALDGVKGISQFLEASQFQHAGFDLVIDATHPFAKKISNYLNYACKEFGQPLIRYERPLEDFSNANVIKSLKELSNFDLRGQNLLMAIGSRYLREAAMYAKNSGANVFARIFPATESLQMALNCTIPNHHLAVFRPQNSALFGVLENAICRKWLITGIICRQSGGKMENLWIEIAKKRKLKLWLISRPVYSDEIEKISSLKSLLSAI